MICDAPSLRTKLGLGSREQQGRLCANGNHGWPNGIFLQEQKISTTHQKLTKVSNFLCIPRNGACFGSVMVFRFPGQWSG